MGKKRKGSDRTISTVVNPIYVVEDADLEDEKDKSDSAGQAAEEGGWMVNLLDWEWRIVGWKECGMWNVVYTCTKRSNKCKYIIF